MPDLALTAAGRLDGVTQQQKIHQAAKAFEQQFVAQLLKPMTETDEASEELFGKDPGSNAFRGLFVDGLAEHAAGGLGIAKIIEDTMAQRLRTTGR
jgi:Rod binding domain-containing protein